MTTYKYEEIFEDIEGDSEHIMMKIPPDICESQGWKEGDTVNIRVEGNGLVLSKSAGASVKEAINLIRKEWYRLNDISTEGMSPRQLALHVGRKSGLMLAMNTLSSYPEGEAKDDGI